MLSRPSRPPGTPQLPKPGNSARKPSKPGSGPPWPRPAPRLPPPKPPGSVKTQPASSSGCAPAPPPNWTSSAPTPPASGTNSAKCSKTGPAPLPKPATPSATAPNGPNGISTPPAPNWPSYAPRPQPQTSLPCPGGAGLANHRKSEHFDGRPGPECAVLFEGQVAAAAVRGVLGPGPGGVPFGHDCPAQFLPAGGERLAGLRLRAGGEPCRGGLPLAVGGCGEDGQDRKPFADPLVHPRLAAGQLFRVRYLLCPDRARWRLLRPPGRVVDGPLGDVEVERADREQGVGRRGPRGLRPAGGASRRLPRDPLLPAGRCRRGQAERADAGMAEFQVAPEQLAQEMGDRPQGRVVRRELPFAEVVRQQLADRPALDAVLADQLGRGELAAGGEHPDAGRSFRREHPGCPQQLVEVHSLAAGLALDRPHHASPLQAVAGGDVADEPALGGHDGGDPPQRQVPGQRADLPGLACLPEDGEGTQITGPGHLAGEQLQPGAGQQPPRVRPDQVPADQQEQPGAQTAALAVAGREHARRGEPRD